MSTQYEQSTNALVHKIRVFKNGNDAALVERFHAESIAGPGQEVRGRENIIKMFECFHAGLTEIKRPQLVLCQGRDIFVEVDMDVRPGV
jgi:hypothetical protein